MTKLWFFNYKKEILSIFLLLLVSTIILIIFRQFNPNSFPGLNERLYLGVFLVGLTGFFAYLPEIMEKFRNKKISEQESVQTIEQLFNISLAIFIGILVVFSIFSLNEYRNLAIYPLIVVIFLGLMILVVSNPNKHTN